MACDQDAEVCHGRRGDIEIIGQRGKVDHGNAGDEGTTRTPAGRGARMNASGIGTGGNIMCSPSHV